MSDERLMKVLLSPHVSEKSTLVAERNRQFVFKVIPDATKPEIKRAVEKMFDVQVDGVRLLNVRGKQKRFGTPGKRRSWKKAYVTLKSGHDIDFLSPEKA